MWEMGLETASQYVITHVMNALLQFRRVLARRPVGKQRSRAGVEKIGAGYFEG